MANVKFYIQGDNSSAMRAMNQVKGAVGNLGQSLNGSLKGAMASAFGVAAIEETIRRTITYADNVDEASQRIDVGIEKLQEWTFAAKQSGAAMEDMVLFTEKLSKFAATKAGAIELKAKGINPNQTPEALLESVWKFANKKAPQQVTPFLMDIGGKSGGKLYNVFQNDLAEVSEQARKFGAVMDTETTVKLAALSDQFSILSQVIASQVGPALIALAGWAYKIAVKASGGVEKVATRFMAATPEIKQSLSNKKTDLLNMFAPGLGTAFAMKEGLNKFDKKEADIATKQSKFGIKQGSSLQENLADIDKETEDKLKAFQGMMDNAIKNALNRGKTQISPPPPETPQAVARADIKSQPSSYVSIGGIAGISTQFRIEKINKDMLLTLQEIALLIKNNKGELAL